MTSAERPALASPAATLMAVVVFPTPPFWLATLMILATFGSLRIGSLANATGGRTTDPGFGRPCPPWK